MKWVYGLCHSFLTHWSFSVASTTLWREYEIIIDDESMPDEKTNEDEQSSLSLAVKSDESGEAIQSVFDKFEVI